MSTRDAGYNALAYHAGTVWPHDTALVAEGMRRYGYRDEAAIVCTALLDAAEAFANQLPEVFAGFARDDASVPVEYPSANRPQAFAAGAPLLALRTLLSLDVFDDRLAFTLEAPKEIGRVHVGGLLVRGHRHDLEVAEAAEAEPRLPI
jgi:glycogen debranching enzyme